MVSVSKETGYQHLQELTWTTSQQAAGQAVKLKEVPFLVKLFRLVAPNGDTEWLITNDLKAQTNRFVAENKNAVRWQIEPGGRCRVSSQLQATHRFRAVPVPQSSSPTQPPGLLLPRLGIAQGQSQAGGQIALPTAHGLVFYLPQTPTHQSLHPRHLRMRKSYGLRKGEKLILPCTFLNAPGECFTQSA